MATPVLPHPIVLMEAERGMRMHHMLWHTARNGWSTFPQAVRQAFAKLGWAPPRPAIDAQRRPILDNDSGEDFLYMHHQMIAEVNDRLAQINDPAYPKVEGWGHFPAPDDPDYPVPAPYSLGSPDDDAGLAEIKSRNYFQQTFEPQATRFEDAEYLRTISLAELGARVEFTVHNWAHLR